MNAEKLEEISLLCKSLNLIYVVRDKNNENNNLKYFENFFNEVTFMDNGLEALKIFDKNKFSVVITDIEIHDFNGFDLIEKIKSIDKSIVTIIYTSNEDRESFFKTIQLKIDGYLMHPFDENNFLEIIYRASESCKDKKLQIEKKKNNFF